MSGRHPGVTGATRARAPSRAPRTGWVSLSSALRTWPRSRDPRDRPLASLSASPHPRSRPRASERPPAAATSGHHWYSAAHQWYSAHVSAHQWHATAHLPPEGACEAHGHQRLSIAISGNHLPPEGASEPHVLLRVFEGEVWHVVACEHLGAIELIMAIRAHQFQSRWQSPARASWSLRSGAINRNQLQLAVITCEHLGALELEERRAAYAELEHLPSAAINGNQRQLGLIMGHQARRARAPAAAETLSIAIHLNQWQSAPISAHHLQQLGRVSISINGNQRQLALITCSSWDASRPAACARLKPSPYAAIIEPMTCDEGRHHSAVVGEAISEAISETISEAISEAIDEVMRDFSCQPEPISRRTPSPCSRRASCGCLHPPRQRRIWPCPSCRAPWRT